jgi:hypothetical protein
VSGSPCGVWSPQNIRLRPLSQSRFRELFDCLQLKLVCSRNFLSLRVDSHIFRPILIYCQMDSTERTPPYFIFNDVLINMVLRLAVLFIVCILGSCVQCLLDRTMMRGRAMVMSERTWVGGGRALRQSASHFLSYSKYSTYTCWIVDGPSCSVTLGRSKEMPVHSLLRRKSKGLDPSTYHARAESRSQLRSWRCRLDGLAVYPRLQKNSCFGP